MRNMLAVAALLLPGILSAQATRPDLEARLLKKPLYLRGLWGQDELRFDGAGQLQGSSAAVPFTVAGMEVSKLKLSSTGLILEGDRVGLTFDKDGNYKRVKLAKKDFVGYEDERMKVQIAAPAGGDYSTILDSIFTTDVATLVPLMPREWQSYARKHFLGQADPARPAPPPDAKRIGGNVTAPIVRSAPEPEFSSWARGTKVSGNVLVYLQVDREGHPTNVKLLRPLGMGLDERAMIAVYQYKFSPAMQDGQPVPVEMNVEVNFQIF